MSTFHAMLGIVGWLRAFARSNVRPLATEPAVHAYAYAVAAGHAVVLLFFIDTRVLSGLLASVEPLCWPYFEDCWRYRLHSENRILLVVITYFGIIVVAVTALHGGHLRTYWVTMLVLNGFLFAIVSLDYRLRANEFYMLFWLNLVFLLCPTNAGACHSLSFRSTSGQVC